MPPRAIGWLGVCPAQCLCFWWQWKPAPCTCTSSSPPKGGTTTTRTQQVHGCRVLAVRVRLTRTSLILMGVFLAHSGSGLSPVRVPIGPVQKQTKNTSSASAAVGGRPHNDEVDRLAIFDGWIRVVFSIANNPPQQPRPECGFSTACRFSLRARSRPNTWAIAAADPRLASAPQIFFATEPTGLKSRSVYAQCPANGDDSFRPWFGYSKQGDHADLISGHSGHRRVIFANRSKQVLKPVPRFRLAV